MKLLLTFLLVLCIPRVTSFKCYSCLSSYSWSQCEERPTNCSANANRCVKFHLKYWESRESFVKRCGTKKECSDLENMPVCKFAKKHHEESECKVDCCEGDLCNAGSSTAFSIIVLVPCAVVSLVFLTQEVL